MASPQPVVDVSGLGFRYRGGESDVLHDLSFHIEPGEVFGFLGPNASGKSTTQKVLCRILDDFRGDARVLGRDLRGVRSDYYNDIGVCFEFPNLYEKLTAEENLAFYRGFFDGPTDAGEELLDRLDLPVRDARRVSQYSKGMKMRLGLARSLLNRPKLWFLDEPTTGQDPRHSVLIRDLIRERANAGTTVFLTTHNMTVADELCDRVALLVGGQIAEIDSPRALKLRYARRVARIEYRDGDGGSLASRDFGFADAADKRAFLDFVEAHEVETIHTQEPSLETVFLEVTGRELAP